MKICVAQTKPVTGDIQRNVKQHSAFINLAADHGADLIIFPELSLTGYEPTLAQTLAITLQDPRLDPFQTLADGRRLTIGVGAPTLHPDGVCISLVLFQPHTARQIYSKQFIHPDEEAFFVPGPPSAGLIGRQANIALAICYELSVPEHAARAAQNQAAIYVASVAKFVQSIGKARQRLAEIAAQHAMTVLMANSVGQADGDVCAGGTAVWNPRGSLLAQLDDTHEGFILYDTNTQEISQKHTTA